MKYQGKELVVCRDGEELCQQAAERFVRLAGEAVSATGRFTVALSGGTTPQRLYSLLASDQFQPLMAWSKVHFFFGDERCVPPDHPDSTYGMVRVALLAPAPIPWENVYPILTEKGDAQSVAAEYEKTLKTFFGLTEGQKPRFDLILLGMGTDGHTASLFPGSTALEESGRLVTANYVEKLQAHRITLTFPAINQAANIIFLISGQSKASVLKEVLEGQDQPMRLPSQRIAPVEGKLLFMVDQAAGSKLVNPDGNGVL